MEEYNCGLMAMYAISKEIKDWSSFAWFRNTNREMCKQGVYSSQVRNFLTRKAIGSFNSYTREIGLPVDSVWTDFKPIYLF